MNALQSFFLHQNNLSGENSPTTYCNRLRFYVYASSVASPQSSSSSNIVVTNTVNHNRSSTFRPIDRWNSSRAPPAANAGVMGKLGSHHVKRLMNFGYTAACHSRLLRITRPSAQPFQARDSESPCIRNTKNREATAFVSALWLKQRWHTTTVMQSTFFLSSTIKVEYQITSSGHPQLFYESALFR